MNQFLPLIISLVVALFFGRHLSMWLLSVIPTNRIASEGGRRFATAAVSALAFPLIFAAGFLLFGMSYGLGNFLFVWALITAMNMFLPNRQ
jgi:hypothetical protein